jgi:ribosomal protein S27AE
MTTLTTGTRYCRECDTDTYGDQHGDRHECGRCGTETGCEPATLAEQIDALIDAETDAGFRFSTAADTVRGVFANDDTLTPEDRDAALAYIDGLPA